MNDFKVAVLHLVRKSEGIETFKRFIESYKKYPPPEGFGALFLVFKGFPHDMIPQDYCKVTEGVKFLSMFFPDRFNALHTFRLAVTKMTVKYFDYIIFFNSFSEILKPTWFTRMVFSLHGAGGMYSCTGSNESMRNFLCWDMFPNPHIRTNAFIINREIVTQYWNPYIWTKFQAHMFESGKSNISQRLSKAGYKVGVVTSEGLYGLTCLDCARSFRDREQQDVLLVADNQTRRYSEGTDDEREYLYNLAWNTGVQLN